MPIRTFRQNGQGYGSSPVSIEAKINNVVVYSGPINTVDQPLPVLPQVGTQIGSPLFSWENDVLFEGTQTLEIAVSGGVLLLTETVANYPPELIADPSLDPETTWRAFYKTDIVNDPFTDETINGVLQESTPVPPLTGQWYWMLPPGSTFSATVNIQPGYVPPAV